MKILRELDFDARQPISQIARTIGLSTEVTAYRIKQLEQKGIIKGYYPVIDISKLGYMFCRFRLVVENLNSQIEEEIMQLAKENKNVGWVIISGSCTVGIVLYAKSIREAEESYTQLISRFPTAIKSKEFSVAHRIYHFRKNYLYNTIEDEQLVWGGGNVIAIDDIDRKLLFSLTQNARMKYTDLATQVGLTPMAVLNRVKEMQKKKLILGFRCSLDLKKLGYNHHKIYLYLQNVSTPRKETLKEMLRTHQNVVYITEALGKSDLEFEMHVKADHEVHDFMKELREKFPEIKNFENTIFYREEIVRYMPEK